jgi:Golgi phosphoprotein 3
MSSPSHFTFVEEIVLLALDDTTGALLPMPAMAFSYAIAGAVLCDLALLNRIDTDPNQLVVLDPTPTGDPLLDDALAAIVAAPKPVSASLWIGAISERARHLEAAALDRLVGRGVLRCTEKKFLWVFGVRRYPGVDNQERTEVRTRLTSLILGEDLPDPRDATLISLLTACRLAPVIFPGPQFAARSDRLATLAKMDLVGREVAASLDAIARALTALPVGM